MALSFRYLITGWLVWAGLTATIARAQSPANGERQFTLLAGGEANWQGVAYQPVLAKVVPLTFSHQRRSDVQKAVGETLVFTRERIDPSTGQPVRVPVARVSWPAGVRKALLVFVPRSIRGADGLEFDVLAIDDGFEAFPGNSLRVLNLTPVNLLGRIGERQAEFKPGVSPVTDLADLVPPGAAAVALALGMRTETGALTLYLGPLETSPSTRALVMVLPPKTADSRKVRVFMITQPVPKPLVVK
ncbi:MAG: hypothetical protein K0R17_2737 [Rariglobus sp.]|jgi:hypothetical protein|nr:hypothetical protein [Rariglobus sp.]